MKQKRIFAEEEGDQWFQRNMKLLHAKREDIVLKVIDYLRLGSSPKKTLEIGCSNGWRLASLHEKYGWQCYGIDPSSEAISAGRKEFPGIDLKVGSADELPFESQTFEFVIVGCCFYLCDRDDLFKIAYEIDRMLVNNGLLLIIDFSPPIPFKNKYTHSEGIYSYKLDYAKMFTWNPHYTRSFYQECSMHSEAFSVDPNDRVGVNVLRKNLENAYPDNPFSQE